MSNSSPRRVNVDQLEKVLIGIVLGSILAIQFLFKNDKSYAQLFMGVHALAFFALIISYLRTNPRTYWTILVAALLTYPVSKVLFFVDHSYQGVLYIIDAVVLTLGGILFLYQSIRKSLEYKAFESLGFLLGLFLAVLPWIAIILGSSFEGFPLLYNFGIAFIIGTIMYGENLWDQYEKAQQNFIMLVLLISLTNIIVIVSKQL